MSIKEKVSKFLCSLELHYGPVEKEGEIILRDDDGHVIFSSVEKGQNKYRPFVINWSVRKCLHCDELFQTVDDLEWQS